MKRRPLTHYALGMSLRFGITGCSRGLHAIYPFLMLRHYEAERWSAFVDLIPHFSRDSLLFGYDFYSGTYSAQRQRLRYFWKRRGTEDPNISGGLGISAFFGHIADCWMGFSNPDAAEGDNAGYSKPRRDGRLVVMTFGTGIAVSFTVMSLAVELDIEGLYLVQYCTHTGIIITTPPQRHTAACSRRLIILTLQSIHNQCTPHNERCR